MSNNYKKAYSEILEIIKYLPEEEREKIPEEKIKFFEENCDKNYEFKFNSSKPLEEQEFLRETYAIIIILFRDYFATETQKEKLQEILFLNEEKRQRELREKYNPEKIMTQRVQKPKIEPKESTELIEIKEENVLKKVFKKIVNWIKNLKK